VDRKAVESIDLGPCQCPDTPHETDWVHLTKYQSYADWLAIVDAGNAGLSEFNRVRFLRRIKDWNLVDEKGKKVLVTTATIADLDAETANKIQDALNNLDEADKDEPTLPNAPSAS
jgi:hypothetical protein